MAKKITEKIVLEVLRLKRIGYFDWEIAKELGISEAAVVAITRKN